VRIVETEADLERLEPARCSSVERLAGVLQLDRERDREVLVDLEPHAEMVWYEARSAANARTASRSSARMPG
jgi:hypothetical protein